MSKSIELVNVKKSFNTPRGPLLVLNIPRLQLDNDSHYCLTGPSGSGKTTLVNMLSGLTLPDCGSVLVCGQELHTMGEVQRDGFRALNLGFVFQAFHLLPALTALENTMLPGFLAGKETSLYKKRSLELLEIVGLKDRLDHKPEQLSRGEQQRVAIARALINSPRLVLADEPTGNLDRESAQVVLKSLTEAVSEVGATLVMVSHSVEALSFAKEVKMSDINILEEAV